MNEAIIIFENENRAHKRQKIIKNYYIKLIKLIVAHLLGDNFTKLTSLANKINHVIQFHESFIMSYKHYKTL